MAEAVPVGASGATLYVTPPERWSSATAKTYTSSGSLLETATASLPGVSTTVAASPTSARQFDLASTSSVEVGVAYEVSDPAVGQAQIATVDTVGTSQVTLVEPLAATPSVGSTFRDVRFRVSIGSDSIPRAGLNYKLELTSGESRAVVIYHVVHQLFEDPCSEMELRRIIASANPNHHLLDRPGTVALLVQQVSDMVQRRCISRGQYPFLVGDPFAFKEAGEIAAYLALSRYKLFLDVDPLQYERDLRIEFDKAITRAIASLTPIDADNDCDYEAPDESRHARVVLSR